MKIIFKILLFMSLAGIIFLQGSCYGKYEDKIQVLQTQLDSLDSELGICNRKFDQKEDEYDLLNEEYKAEIFKIKEDFTGVVSLFEKISRNQIYIQEFVNSIHVVSGEPVNIEPWILDSIESKRNQINHYLNKADIQIEAVSNNGTFLQRFDETGEEQRKIIQLLQSRVETEKKKYSQLINVIAGLKAKINSLEKEIEISQDSFANEYQHFMKQFEVWEKEKVLFQTQISDFEKNIEEMKEAHLIQLLRKDTQLLKKEYIIDSLKQTIDLRDATILTTKDSLKQNQVAYILEGTKKELRKANVVKSTNRQELKCDYKEQVLANTNKEKILMNRGNLIQASFPIKKILPLRSNATYEIINETDIQILDIENFWKVGEVLVIIVDK